jgi:hypothetical protein
MDGSRFDALTRTLTAPASRLATLVLDARLEVPPRAGTTSTRTSQNW